MPHCRRSLPPLSALLSSSSLWTEVAGLAGSRCHRETCRGAALQNQSPSRAHLMNALPSADLHLGSGFVSGATVTGTSMRSETDGHCGTGPERRWSGLPGRRRPNGCASSLLYVCSQVRVVSSPWCAAAARWRSASRTDVRPPDFGSDSCHLQRDCVTGFWTCGDYFSSGPCPPPLEVPAATATALDLPCCARLPPRQGPCVSPHGRARCKHHRVYVCWQHCT